MAEALYMLTKKVQPGETLVDGIHVCLANDDDGQTSAQTIATVIALLRTAGYPLPDSYFDTRTLMSTAATSSTGVLGADGDYVLILPLGRVEATA